MSNVRELFEKWACFSAEGPKLDHCFFVWQEDKQSYVMDRIQDRYEAFLACNNLLDGYSELLTAFKESYIRSGEREHNLRLQRYELIQVLQYVKQMMDEDRVEDVEYSRLKNILKNVNSEKVDRNERADFERLWESVKGRKLIRAECDQESYDIPFDNGAWEGWKARADFEGKP